MKEVITFTFNELFCIVAAIAEDNNLQTVDDLCDFLDQNDEWEYKLIRYIKGESHDK